MDINSVQNSYSSSLLPNNSTYTVQKINNVDSTATKNTTTSIPTNTIVSTRELNVTAQYNSAKDDASKTDISSILVNDPTILYKSVDSLGSSQALNLGNYLNVLA